MIQLKLSRMKRILCKLLLVQAQAPICCCRDYGIDPAQEYCDCWDTLVIEKMEFDRDVVRITLADHVVQVHASLVSCVKKDNT